MHNRFRGLPAFSQRERRLLWLFVGGLLLMALLFAFLEWARAGFVTGGNDAAPQIAVLVPKGGVFHNIEETTREAVTLALSYPPLGGDVTLSVRFYFIDTTPDSVAWAARRAAHRPGTVAIIGPLTTRQGIAAQSVAPDVPVISTLATSTPSNGDADFWHVLASDTMQIQAIGAFLWQQGLQKTFWVVDSSAYARKMLTFVEQSSGGDVNVWHLEETPLNGSAAADFIHRLEDTQTQAVVYLGAPEGLASLVNTLAAHEKTWAVVTTDAALTDELQTLPSQVPLYYATSFVLLSGIKQSPQEVKAWRSTMGALASAPYALETLQATWAVMAAVGGGPPTRNTVRANLSSVRVLDPLNGERFFHEQWLLPARVAIYQADHQQPRWNDNPLVYLWER